jgi:hypothetical protein
VVAITNVPGGEVEFTATGGLEFIEGGGAVEFVVGGVPITARPWSGSQLKLVALKQA